ncbi:MAG: hypothetical protein ACRD3D_07025 [Terriglobia bacterium]
MFNLRKEQLKVFEAVAAQDFEQRVLVQLGRAFPKECSKIDAVILAETARYGIEKAKSYGISADADVCKFIRVMLVLGRDFDADPRYPWAARTLRDQNLGEPTARVSRLSAQALEAAGQQECGAALG